MATPNTPSVQLSDLTLSLDKTAKERYLEKIALFGDFDPYLLPTSDFVSFLHFANKPELHYPDIYNYLVDNPSVYSKESLKNYKSLEAYSYFVAGWVREVLIKQCSSPNSDILIVKAKVAHSQRLSDTPALPWVAVQKNGVVLCGHCTCMAGLGETCSHVAALLFTIDAGVRMSENQTCTDVACAWSVPSSASVNVPYAPVNEIDFSRPEKKMKSTHKRRVSASRVIPPPSEADIAAVYDMLHKCGQRSAVLSVVEPYNKDFVPITVSKKCPKPLSSLHQPDMVSKPFDTILQKCEEVFHTLTLTMDQVVFVESATRLQSKSSLWFEQRSGRITASNFKSVTCSNPDMPSQSLIKKICYPKAQSFSTKATRWGCDHEKSARDAYVRRQRTHTDLLVSDAGLCLNVCYPYLGATPDGVVQCVCCGKGILEVKCPFCQRDQDINEAISGDTRGLFCLETTDDGHTQLKRNHTYFYQVQAQLAVTGAKYCDFVVWTGRDTFVERFQFDNDFLLEFCQV